MKPIVNVNNLQVAFAYKRDGELKSTYYVYKLLQYPRLLKWLTALTNGILRYNIPLKFLIKKTVFRIFCAGENLDEALDKMKDLDNYKVHAVLDYVSEGEKNEQVFARNSAIIVENIKRIGKMFPGNYISVKVSGLEDPEFLRSINNSRMNQTQSHRLMRLEQRLDSICKAAADNGVIIYIDAEDRFMQDILDGLTEGLMEKYNRYDVVVYNTLQMYLVDRPAYIEHLIKAGTVKNYIPGIKLVRGAYVEKEKQAALAEHRPSPVYDTKEETDQAFNKAVDRCLSQYPRVSTCVASHNEQSNLFAVECMEKYTIPKSKVRFSQLLGMSDNLTFNLAANGYSASKYLPYGEVKKAIPYLIRRAEENSAVNGQLGREWTMLQTEMRRRNSNH